MAPAPKPNIGHTVSHIMPTLVPHFFFSKCGTHISIMWENIRLRRRSLTWPIHCPQIVFSRGLLSTHLTTHQLNPTNIYPPQLKGYYLTHIRLFPFASSGYANPRAGIRHPFHYTRSPPFQSKQGKIGRKRYLARVRHPARWRWHRTMQNLSLLRAASYPPEVQLQGARKCVCYGG